MTYSAQTQDPAAAPRAAPRPTLAGLRQVGARMSETLAARGVGAGFSDEEVESFYAVALTLVGQSDLTRAHPVLTRVCDLRPAEVRYLRALATVRRELGLLAPATVMFQLIDMLEPGNPRNALDLADCWLRDGQIRKARDLLGMTLAYCESQGLSGPESARARALIALLDREGVPDGSHSRPGP